jgi:protein gp37
MGQRDHTKTWNDPVKWNREAEKTGVIPSVFCNSLGDVFDNEVPQEWRDDLFALIKATPFLRWIILTKRIGNAAKMLPADWGNGYTNAALLITVVNQAEADRDIPKLLSVPARWRGLSVEPQLESIRLDNADLMILDWVIQGCESGPHRRPFELDWARSMRDQCVDAGVAYFLKQIPGPGRSGVTETPELDGKTWTQTPWN